MNTSYRTNKKRRIPIWRMTVLFLSFVVGGMIIALSISSGLIFRDLCYLPPERLESANFGRYYEIRSQRHSWMPGPDVKKFTISQQRFKELQLTGIFTQVVDLHYYPLVQRTQGFQKTYRQLYLGKKWPLL